jgi:hypothetical protein
MAMSQTKRDVLAAVAILWVIAAIATAAAGLPVAIWLLGIPAVAFMGFGFFCLWLALAGRD